MGWRIGSFEIRFDQHTVLKVGILLCLLKQLSPSLFSNLQLGIQFLLCEGLLHHISLLLMFPIYSSGRYLIFKGRGDF